MIERMMIMDNIKFAQLDPQQLAKINELEKRLV